MLTNATMFEGLLEAVPDACVGMDQKGLIRFVNRQAESLFGYDRVDLIGQPIETVVPEAGWHPRAANRVDYFAHPSTRTIGFELSARHRDGTEFAVSVHMSYIDTGHVLLVIAPVGEATRHGLVVKAAQLIAAILEHSDDAIIGGTLAGVITSWNAAAERMYGYLSREIIGRATGLLAPEDRAGEIVANLAKADQHVERYETTRVRKDGTVFPVSATVSPIRDEEGAVVGVSIVHRDMTEQKQLLQDAQLMAAIIADADDAIISRTFDGIVTSWNHAAERMYGYFSTEIIGKPASVIVPQDLRGEVASILARISAGEHVKTFETTRIRKDGVAIRVSITSSKIRDRDGAVVGASLIGRAVAPQRGPSLN